VLIMVVALVLQIGRISHLVTYGGSLVMPILNTIFFVALLVIGAVTVFSAGYTFKESRFVFRMLYVLRIKYGDITSVKVFKKSRILVLFYRTSSGERFLTIMIKESEYDEFIRQIKKKSENVIVDLGFSDDGADM